MTVRFTLVNLVRCPPGALFDLSLDVDLHLRSMVAWHEQVVGAPACPLGDLVESAVLRRRLRHLIEVRNTMLVAEAQRYTP